MKFIMQQRRWKVSKQLQAHWAWHIVAGISGDRAHSLDQRKEQRKHLCGPEGHVEVRQRVCGGGVCLHSYVCMRGNVNVYMSMWVYVYMCICVCMCVFMGFSRWC